MCLENQNYANKQNLSAAQYADDVWVLIFGVLCCGTFTGEWLNTWGRFLLWGRWVCSPPWERAQVRVQVQGKKHINASCTGSPHKCWKTNVCVCPISQSNKPEVTCAPVCQTHTAQLIILLNYGLKLLLIESLTSPIPNAKARTDAFTLDTRLPREHRLTFFQKSFESRHSPGNHAEWEWVLLFIVWLEWNRKEVSMQELAELYNNGSVFK